MAATKNQKSKTVHSGSMDDPNAKGFNAQRVKLEKLAGPHRGDANERKGRGGGATRGRGQARRGAKTPSRGKS